MKEKCITVIYIILMLYVCNVMFCRICWKEHGSGEKPWNLGWRKYLLWRDKRGMLKVLAAAMRMSVLIANLIVMMKVH